MTMTNMGLTANMTHTLIHASWSKEVYVFFNQGSAGLPMLSKKIKLRLRPTFAATRRVF